MYIAFMREVQTIFAAQHESARIAQVFGLAHSRFTVNPQILEVPGSEQPSSWVKKSVGSLGLSRVFLGQVRGRIMIGQIFSAKGQDYRFDGALAFTR